MSRLECPSGLVVAVRKLKTKEANILADAQASRKGVQFDNLLASVTEEVLDWGPYSPNKEGKLDWGDVLVGDRMFAQLKVRVLTFGADYDFNIQCPSCKESIKWGVDLSEVPTQMLAPEDLATFQNGNRGKVTMPWGCTYTFQLLTGKTSRKAAELVKGAPQGRVTASLLARITHISDENGAEVMNRRAHLDDLDLMDTQDLVAALDEHDCGIETSIEIECPECGAVSGVELPFDRREYWGPSRKTPKAS